jgi:hypothetical protein
MMSLRRFFDHVPETLEQQPENGLALPFGPTQTLCVVVKFRGVLVNINL